MTKKEYLKKAIIWAKKRGFSGIRANIEGFETPSGFKKIDGEKPIIPHVTGKKYDNKYYIEIATKSDEIQTKISKWKLLSTLAQLKGGKLFLMAPKGHKAFVERILSKHNLNNTQLFYLPNIQ